MKCILNLKHSPFLFLVFFMQSSCFSNSSSSSSSSEKMNVDNRKDSLPIKQYLFGDQPYPECHASTIVHLKNGEFLAAWFGGTKEKDDDVGIWMTKGKPGAWGKTFEVAKINRLCHCEE